MPPYRQHTDSDLVSLLTDGDEVAFVEIYRRHWRRLYNAAFKRLQDEDQCEDLVQNIFIDLWERRREVLIGNLEAYLITAVKFQVLKFATRERSARHFVDALDSGLTSSLRSDSSLMEGELAGLLQLWVAALPEKRKTIFLMHFTEGMDPEQIAVALGLTPKTVQNQLALASGTIRNHLSKLLVMSVLLEVAGRS